MYPLLDSTTGATTRWRPWALLGAGRCWATWSRWTTASTPCWARWVTGWCDGCVTYVLLQEVELTDEFKANYEKWLEKEVYTTQIEWDSLLAPSYH